MCPEKALLSVLCCHTLRELCSLCFSAAYPLVHLRHAMQPVVLERVPDHELQMDGAASWMHTKVRG